MDRIEFHFMPVPSFQQMQPELSEESGVHSFSRKLMAELQPAGPATHTGLASWNLRLTFAPSVSAVTGSATDNQP